MQNLISKGTGLMAIFPALVVTPMLSQSAIAQSTPTQATQTAMSDCCKKATGESIGDGEISHNGVIHRRNKDKPA